MSVFSEAKWIAISAGAAVNTLGFAKIAGFQIVVVILPLKQIAIQMEND